MALYVAYVMYDSNSFLNQHTGRDLPHTASVLSSARSRHLRYETVSRGACYDYSCAFRTGTDILKGILPS